MSNKTFISQIFSRNMLQCIFTGFTSGLPLYFLIQLLPAWLRSEQVDLKTIGFMTLIGFPYTWKFLIAPLLDRYYPRFLGRRRSWMFITQVFLCIFIALLGQLNPQYDMSMIAVMATLVAVFSAIQDIVVDAYRREILSDEELGLGNSIHVNAYRIAGLIPGGISLILSDRYSWEIVFIFTAFFMLPGVILSLFLSHEPELTESPSQLSFEQAFLVPFKEFFERKGVLSAVVILVFIFLYKFGDSLATSLQSAFILDMGFSKTELGTVVKVNSLWAMIVSGIAGGLIMLKLSINRALWLFGFVQLITILGFVWLASFGKFDSIGSFEISALTLVIICEYMGVGLGAAAFVAFMARETNKRYTATQLAIFTSLAAIPSKVFGSFSGVLVENMGYYHFFWLCFVTAIPGMICLIWVAPWREKQVKS